MNKPESRWRRILRLSCILTAAVFLAAVSFSASAQPTNTYVTTVSVPLPSGMVVTPNNKYVYVVSNVGNALSVITTATNTVVNNAVDFGGNGNPQYLGIAPKGKEILVTSPGSYNSGIWGIPGAVLVITGVETGTPSLAATIPGLGLYPYCVGVNPAGTQAWVGNAFESDCSVINLKNNTVLPLPIQTGDGPACVAFTKDGKNAYEANLNDGTVDEIDTATQLTVGNPIPVGQYPTSILLTPDGSHAYVSGYGGTVSVISTATNTVTTTIPITTSEAGNYWFGSAMTPDGLYLYVPNQNAQSVVMISTQTNTIVGNPIALGQTPGVIAISPNGKHLYIAQMYNWTVAIYNITGG